MVVKILCLIAFIAVTVLIYRLATKNDNNHHVVAAGVVTPTDNGGEQSTGLLSLDTITAEDPAFDRRHVTEKLSNLYVQLQDAWEAGDLTPMKPYLSPALFSEYFGKLAEKRLHKQSDHIEHVSVLGLTLKGWYRADGQDHILALIDSRSIQYTTDDATGGVISGDKTTEIFATYEYTLSRPSGSKTTTAKADLSAFTCPNCGGSVNLNQTSVCPFCGQALASPDFGWSIESINMTSEKAGR